MERSRISRKQAGVIFAMCKKGQLKVENWVMKNIWGGADAREADYATYDDWTEENRLVRSAIDAIFSGKIEEAQIVFDSYVVEQLPKFTEKGLKRLDREFVR